MNLRSALCMLIFTHCFLQSGQPNNLAQSPLPTINITVHTANRADLNQINDLNQQANHAAIQKTDVATKVSSDPGLQDQLYKFLQKQSDYAQGASLNVFNWVSNNKIKTGCLSIVLMYGCIALQIYRAHSIINDPSSWSNWHHGRSLEDLFATPQALLEADLLFAIQTKYVHPVNPTDFIYSIVQSSVSLKKEIEIVQNQIWRYEWIATCRCLPIFFIDLQEVEALKERNRKLLFIQHLFASWCAHYKIDKN